MLLFLHRLFVIFSIFSTIQSVGAIIKCLSNGDKYVFILTLLAFDTTSIISDEEGEIISFFYMIYI